MLWLCQILLECQLDALSRVADLIVDTIPSTCRFCGSFHNCSSDTRYCRKHKTNSLVSRFGPFSGTSTSVSASKKTVSATSWRYGEFPILWKVSIDLTVKNPTTMGKGHFCTILGVFSVLKAPALKPKKLDLCDCLWRRKSQHTQKITKIQAWVRGSCVSLEGGHLLKGYT